jgi:hypothetical protein
MEYHIEIRITPLYLFFITVLSVLNFRGSTYGFKKSYKIKYVFYFKFSNVKTFIDSLTLYLFNIFIIFNYLMKFIFI